MRLIEHEYCYCIGEVFPPTIIAGFTKNNLGGAVPEDIFTALAFVNQKVTIGSLTQPHTSGIKYIEKEGLYEGDGLVTQTPALTVVVKTADCLPLLFYNQSKEALGCVHMGWRSAKEGIVEALLKQPLFSRDPSSIQVILGVGLRACCYEVGEEFLSYEPLSAYITQRGEKYFFNPSAFVKDTLKVKGIGPERIFDLSLCSACSGKEVFSYRATGTSSRTLTFIVKIQQDNVQ